jgi:glutathione S-transferase
LHIVTSFLLKISSRGVVPVLVDGGFQLNDARAIASFLVSQYANESQRELYPTITMDRARVDEMMFYDATVLNRTWQELMVGNITLK